MSRRPPASGPQAPNTEPPSVEVSGALDLIREPAPGTVLSGRYVLESQLGQGGMGWVWRARDVELARAVAIKILLPTLAVQPDVLERFVREARGVAALDHPNVVPVHDVGRDGSWCYFVMKLLPGKPLHLRVEEGTLGIEQAIDVIVQVLEGLEHLHERGLVHRDIKPGNVIVSPEGRATIVDFGILRAQSHEPRMTATGIFVGTPEYIAPELVRGEPGEPRSDLYSVGATLYELLTGDVPFHGESPIEIATRHLRDPAPSPSTVRAGIPEAIDRVVLRALAKRPEGRWGTAAEMRVALLAARSAIGTAAPTRGAVTEHLASPARGLRVRPGVWFGAIAVAATAALGLIVAASRDATPTSATVPPSPVARPVVTSTAALERPPASAAPQLAPAPAAALETAPTEPPERTAPARPAPVSRPPAVRDRPGPSPTRSVAANGAAGEPAPRLGATAAPAKEPPAVTGSTIDRARAALRSGAASQAVALFQQASRERPGSAAPFRGLGDAYLAIGNRTAATAAYRRYLMLDPGARDRNVVERKLSALGAR